MDKHIHRIERSCHIYEPGHTASYKRIAPVIPDHPDHEDDREWADKGDEPPSARASVSAAALNAKVIAGSIALTCRHNCAFSVAAIIRCRGPPFHLFSKIQMITEEDHAI